MSFFESFQRILPSWLTSGDGGKVAASLSLLADDFAARARLGLLARFPAYAPDDEALAAIGRDRRIIRGINEPRAAYAARLSTALDDLKTRGNPFTLLRQLRAYLQAPCVVRTVDRKGNWYTIEADGTEVATINAANWNWDGGAASEWSRFWVVIYPVNGITPWAPTPGVLGDASLWSGALRASSTATIGTTATVDQVASVRQIIRDWKPAGTTCEWIIVAFDAATFTPAGATDPAGAWAGWSNHTGAPVRLSSARYWRGVSSS